MRADSSVDLVFYKSLLTCNFFVLLHLPFLAGRSNRPHYVFCPFVFPSFSYALLTKSGQQKGVENPKLA